MLQSVKKLYGKQLGASDGEIGHVKDFYFDDHLWAIRYLVVDTGTWLTGRQVLLSPHSIGRIDPSKNDLDVRLTKKQIEHSPAMDSHKPISRQYEEEYYSYYGWPYYWQGEGLWGMSGAPMIGTPVLELPMEPLMCDSDSKDQPTHKRVDKDLRSMHAVTGYAIHAKGGIMGEVVDFIMDIDSWAIRKLIIRTSNWPFDVEVQLAASSVSRISYENSEVFVNLTQDEVKNSQVYKQTPTGALL